MLTWVGNNSDPSFSRSLSNHAQTRWKLESNRTTLYLIIWDLCNWRWKPKLESPHLKWEMAFQSSFDLRQFRVLGRGGGWTHGQLQTQRLDLLDPQTCLSVTSYRIGFDNWKWSHLIANTEIAEKMFDLLIESSLYWQLRLLTELSQ